MMATYGMLDNIKDHSVMVARIAEFLARGLRSGGCDIPLDLTISGALLHDIGKTFCLNNGCNHALKGKEICLEHGFEQVAVLVEEHVILGQAFPELPISAKEVVYYADKRVNHDQIVSLQQRLDYIIERYGDNDQHRIKLIRINFQRCIAIEKEIFSYLDLQPDDLAAQVEAMNGEVWDFFQQETQPANHQTL